MDLRDLASIGQDVLVMKFLVMFLSQKIWKNQYVNLALLVKGTSELEEFCSGSSLCVSSKGTIETRPRECHVRVPYIDNWTDAFIIYTSIYITAYQEEAPSMLEVYV